MSVTPRFQLGAHTLPYRAESLDRALRGIAEAGYERVGLFTEHSGKQVISERPSLAEVRQLRQSFENFGLTPVAMFARRAARVQIEALRADLDLCAAMGMPLLQASGPWPLVSGRERKPEMAWYGEVERFLALMTVGAEEAEQRGVTIVLKPHRGPTATGADLVDLIGRIGSTAVRACWDAGNVRFYEGLDSEDDLEDSGVARFVSSVCIKDHTGGPGETVFPVPGQGDVDHLRMLRSLATAGFHGPLLVERVDQPTVEATDAALAQSFTFLQSVVTKVEED